MKHGPIHPMDFNVKVFSQKVLRPGEDDILVVYGYKRHWFFSNLSKVLSILSLGVLPLLFYWAPGWRLKFSHRPCTLEKCDKVMIQDRYKQTFVERIKYNVKHDNNCKLPTINPYDISTPVPKKSCTQHGLFIANKGGFKEVAVVRFFVNKLVKYVWDPDRGRFKSLMSIEEVQTTKELLSGNSMEMFDENSRSILYGSNEITTRDDSYLSLVLRGLLAPFPIYQVCSNVLYFYQEYYLFAIVIDSLTMASILYAAWKEKGAQEQIKLNIKPPIAVRVLRKVKGDPVPRKLMIKSNYLVPGDILFIPRNGYEFMPCDALIISGQCIVSESMLTGESMPINKVPLRTKDDQYFSSSRQNKHMLHSGCNILQTDVDEAHNYLVTVVLKTGFSTLNGNRIRYIMYPKPEDFKFSRDISLYLGCLATLAIFGIIYKLTLNFTVENNSFTTLEIVMDSVDLITTAVTPALPACLAVGIVIAYRRMRKEDIIIINANAINVAGAINAVIFDKTGTLTENDISILGIIEVEFNENMRQLMFGGDLVYPTKLGYGLALKCLVSCHTLTYLNGILSGDPLDIKMFESTKWRMKEMRMVDTDIKILLRPPMRYKGRFYLGVVCRYPFETNMQRMSVICNVRGTHYFEIYCKGSPETMHALCDPQSMPENYYEECSKNTKQGYRVLALAFKYLSDYTIDDMKNVKELPRELIECNLWFLGFLVMENPLKNETIPIIQDLMKIKMRVAIATGDGLLTTISIAKQCGLIKKNDKIIRIHAEGGPERAQEIKYTYVNDTDFEESRSKRNSELYGEGESEPESYILAITGDSFDKIRKYFPDIIPKLMVKGTIFSRMLPEQKGQLIEHLKEMDYYVAMCGDGSNDCRALREAHAGISLSQAETSIAANFISSRQDITAIKTVLREGRAALSTSFGVFQYLSAYCSIQVVTVLILSTIRSDLPGSQYLYMDLFQMTILIDFASLSDTKKELSIQYPETSLFGFIPFISLILYLLLNASLQVTVFKVTTVQEWWREHIPRHRNDYSSSEESAIFSITSFQSLYLAIAYFQGEPHRTSIYRNYFFIIYLYVNFTFCLFLTLEKETWLHEYLNYSVIPSEPYRLFIIGMMACNGLAMLFIKKVIINVICRKIKDNCLRKELMRYEKVEEELKLLKNWPPVQTRFTSITDKNRLQTRPTIRTSTV